MNSLLRILVISSFCVTLSSAFEPNEPPPKKTMAWTSSWLASIRVPLIDFEDATIHEAVDFFHLMYPVKYRVEIDCSKIGKIAVSKVTFKAKGLTFIEALGRVAEAADLNILISPGKVYLIPKNPG